MLPLENESKKLRGLGPLVQTKMGMGFGMGPRFDPSKTKIRATSSPCFPSSCSESGVDVRPYSFKNASPNSGVTPKTFSFKESTRFRTHSKADYTLPYSELISPLFLKILCKSSRKHSTAFVVSSAIFALIFSFIFRLFSFIHFPGLVCIIHLCG